MNDKMITEFSNQNLTKPMEFKRFLTNNTYLYVEALSSK